MKTWNRVIDQVAGGSPENADFIKGWMKRLHHNTCEPVRYIRLVGPPGSGKTAFCEAIKLFCNTVSLNGVLAGQAFNSELEGARVGIIEERATRDEKVIRPFFQPTLVIHKPLEWPKTVRNHMRIIETTNEDYESPFPVMVFRSQPIVNQVRAGILMQNLKDELGDLHTNVLA